MYVPFGLVVLGVELEFLPLTPLLGLFSQVLALVKIVDEPDPPQHVLLLVLLEGEYIEDLVLNDLDCLSRLRGLDH